MAENQMHNHLIDDPAAIYIQKCPGSEYFDTVVGFIEDIVIQEDFKVNLLPPYIHQRAINIIIYIRILVYTARSVCVCVHSVL